MHLSPLFSVLVGTLPPAKSNEPSPPLTSNTLVCSFIEKGHAIEYIEVGPERKRVVALFFGPDEFAIRCHLGYSKLEALGNVRSNLFTHGQVMHMLRKFPESRVYYRELRRRYQEKVEDRIHTLTALTGPERFAHLKKCQPWVFKYADIEDIASYLGISVEMVKSLQRSR
jgi:hypothetical protein